MDRTCCCGLSLHTGTIIIAVLNILASIPMVGITILCINLLYETAADDLGSNETVFLSSWVTVSWICLIIYTLEFIASILLLVGTIKKIGGLCKLWVYYQFILIPFWIILDIAYTFLASYFTGPPLLAYLVLRIRFVFTVREFVEDLYENKLTNAESMDSDFPSKIGAYRGDWRRNILA